MNATGILIIVICAYLLLHLVFGPLDWYFIYKSYIWIRRRVNGKC